MWEKLWEIGIRKERCKRMMKKMTKCARSAVMLDGVITNYVDTARGVAEGYTPSPSLFKACIDE